MTNQEHQTPQDHKAGSTSTGQLQPGTDLTDPTGDKDGRNREWEDRARVNLEPVAEGTRSMVERDFEAEEPTDGSKQKAPDPAY